MSDSVVVRMEVENWMNFVRVDVALSRRTFIIGPNACGKSNFLDVLRFLRDLVTEGGGLAKAVEVRGSMNKVRSLFARANSHVRICVVVKQGPATTWKYDLAFTHASATDPSPSIVHEKVFAVSGNRERAILERPDVDDKRDAARLTQTAIQQVTANKPFRGLAEFFRGITDLHAVPQLIREGQSTPAGVIGGDPFGRDLLQLIRATPTRTKRARLKRIEKVLRSVVPQLQQLELTRDLQGRPHLRANFQHWRPQGAYQTETQFSDGTLRLIGLLWALQEKGGPLLLKEPELSLHPAIVRRLAPLIFRAQKAAHNRQVLLSTHSVDLLADEGIADDEILLVEPGDNGSTIVVGTDELEVRKLMEAGVLASEAALSRTETTESAAFERLAP